MRFRQLGSILADVTSSPEKLRAAAMESAGPLEHDKLEQLVIAEKDATKPEDLAGVTSGAGGGVAPVADRREEDADNGLLPGIGKGERPTRSRDGWTVRQPRKSTDSVPEEMIARYGRAVVPEPHGTYTHAAAARLYLATLDGARVHARAPSRFLGAGTRSAILVKSAISVSTDCSG